MKTQEKNQMSITLKVVDKKSQKEAELLFEHSNHSFQRASQRGLSTNKISMALEYGECFFKQGLIYYVLGERNLPEHLSKCERQQFKNIVVVVAGDTNLVVTCYRSNNPFKNIRLKSKSLYKNYPLVA